MPDWKRRPGSLPLHQASVMSWMPGITQGFTTRIGGESSGLYDNLNLGTNTDDDPLRVAANRRTLWNSLRVREEQVALAEQVHGASVARVVEGGPPVPGVDALITDAPNVLLMLCYADCVPLYLYDPVGRAVGLVHAGWRGAAAGIVAHALDEMREAFGTRPFASLAAVGPCIGGDNYEVGADVADRFRSAAGGRAATAVLPRSEWAGTYNLNLRQVVYAQLLEAGFRADYVAVSDADTLRDKRDFFSHRRDAGRTGRMAAFIGMQDLGVDAL